HFPSISTRARTPGFLAATFRRALCSKSARGSRPVQFRSKIFAVLALVGVVPAVVLGSLSFYVNRAELERTVRSAETRVAAGAASGPPYAADASMRLPIALRLDGEHLLAAELSLAQLSRQMRQTSQGGTLAYLATRAGRVLAQPESFELSPDEHSLVAAGAGGRALVRADGQRWLAVAAPVGTLGWVVVVSQREDVALRPAALVRRYTLFWVAVSPLLVLTLGALLSRRVTEAVQQLQQG